MDYTAFQAAEIALRQLGKPSSAREITDYILRHQLWETSGKTPDATIGARIYEDLKSEKPIFLLLGPGMFALKEWDNASQSKSTIDSCKTDAPKAEERLKHNEENVYYNASEVKKIFRARLVDMSPSAFEHLIGKLLEAIGFQAAVTKASHDGGVDVRGELVIDNVIRVKMSVQAKRYKIGNNVQAPVVQQLRGSVNTVELERGLLITTSDFTKGAYQEAEAYGKANIDLMNGEKLVELLLKYEIGVKSQKVYTIDESMFSDLATLSSVQPAH